jgi:transcriptional regulator with XRE-family HTH domain
MSVAQKVKNIRGEIPISLFAKHVGVSEALVSYVENGKQRPGLKMIIGLSKFSGKPMEYWVD